MSGDPERKLLPRLGDLDSVLEALGYVELSLSQRPEPPQDAASVVSDVPHLEGVVVALSNLSAYLIQLVEILSTSRDGAVLDRTSLIDIIRKDQHLHLARRQLDALDSDGFPFE